MTYKRKTEDEFQLHVNYGHGWEHEVTESTWSVARQRKREYAENCPQYSTKIVKKRIPLQAKGHI